MCQSCGSRARPNSVGDAQGATPTAVEMEDNPRSRSAQLRVIEKL